MNAILLLAMATPNAHATLPQLVGTQLNCKWNIATGQLECETPDRKDNSDDWGIQTSEVEGDSDMPSFLLAVYRGDYAGSIYVLQDIDKREDKGVYVELVVDVPADTKGWNAMGEDIDGDRLTDLVVELERETLIWYGEITEAVSWEKPDEMW